jgi:hypothetical protein
LRLPIQFEQEISAARLKALVDDSTARFSECERRAVELNADGVRESRWMTRKFALDDCDRNPSILPPPK